MSSDGYDFDELDSAFLDQVAEIEAAHIVASGGGSSSNFTSNNARDLINGERGNAFASSSHNPPQTCPLFRLGPKSTSLPQTTATIPNKPRSTAIILSSSPPSPVLKPRPQPIDLTNDFDEYDDTFDMDDATLAELAAIETQYSRNPSGWKPPSTTRQTTLRGEVLAPEASTASSSHHPYGQRARKTKVWDRTAFAKTGKMKKGKGKNSVEEDDGGEEVDFEQFPAPFVSDANCVFSRPPLMKLEIDREAAQTWVYPLNKPKRNYQYNIVRNSLFENSLVALPTGLGKTFIAGVIMLNYYRWFPTGRVVFVAPTKPLVAQQIEACHHTCGIPQRDAVEMTGEVARPLRARHWEDKRVLYMTPQTLMNDLATENCDASRIVLVVIDEAHRATGDYAYCQVVRFLMAKNPHFRVLALTATPGSTPEAVQVVVDSLHVSHIEIRDEEALDLREYVHKKRVVHTVVPLDGEVKTVKTSLEKAMQKDLTKIIQAGILPPNVDPARLHNHRCRMLKASLHPGQKWAYGPLSHLETLARAMAYLLEQSLSMCHNYLVENFSGPMGSNGKKPPPKKRDTDPAIKAVLKEFDDILSERNGKMPSHPKMDKLLGITLDYFGGGDGDGTTRAMVFCTFRECVEEIVQVLNGHGPILRAAPFVGQGTDKGGKKGLTQKQQIELIQRFKKGEFNILVSTSIGEEGLDIGEVDLIICYDSQKTPIRMLQRIGRTGRKRDGRIELLSSAGREEYNFGNAKEKYQDVQESIVRGDQLELFGDVERLLPDDVHPACVETVVEVEEFQPKTSGGKRKANRDDDVKPLKKKRKSQAMEVPEGAVMGFVPVNELLLRGAKGKGKVVGDEVGKKRKKSLSKAAREEDSMENVRYSPGGAAGGFTNARKLTDLWGMDTDDEEIAGGSGISGTTIETPALKKAKKAKPTKRRSKSPTLVLDSPEVPKVSSTEETVADKCRSMRWLLSDDEDVGTAGPSRKGACRSSSPPVAPQVVHRSHAMDVDRPDWMESSDPPGLPEQPEVEMGGPDSPAVDMTFPVRGPSKGRTNRNQRRAVIASDDVSTSASSPPPKRKKKQVYSRIGNPIFDMEAAHSGDESAGGSDYSDENEYDRSFVTDGAATQAPGGYDQEAVYRRGLMTQAPGAPLFARRPVRSGMFKGGSGRGVVVSSSPGKDTDDVDEYEYGSFVVEDEPLEMSSERLKRVHLGVSDIIVRSCGKDRALVVAKDDVLWSVIQPNIGPFLYIRPNLCSHSPSAPSNAMAQFLANPDGTLFGSLRLDIQAAMLEFCGTFLFLLLGLGGIQAAAVSNQAALAASQAAEGGSAINTVASINQLLYISVSMGLSLLISVWLFYRVTGGIFNPAVSTALLFVGAIGPVRWALCCFAQMVGAIAASGVLLALLPGPLASNTAPGPGVNKAQAVFIEMFLTAALVLAVLMLAAEKHRSTPFAPIGVGLTLFACHLFGVVFTGASMNTARSFGPAVVSGFASDHWIYWIGPFLGSLLATFFYSGLKHIRYWTINPNQDVPNPANSPPGPMDTIRAVTSSEGAARARTGSVNARHSTASTAAVSPTNGRLAHEKAAPLGGANYGPEAV
ncbi:3'-5' DNA helicase [Tulasnella sp. 403]|nr:3'-5' DNA helicase [Tulasnella sp. 403]